MKPKMPKNTLKNNYLEQKHYFDLILFLNTFFIRNVSHTQSFRESIKVAFLVSFLVPCS